MNPIFLVNGIFPAYSVSQPGFSLESVEANFAYVLDSEGWKIYKRNGVSVALIPVEIVSGLPRLEQNIQLTAAKIPLDLIRRVTAWFSAVYKKMKSEAVGYLYYHASTQAWDFLPPTQTATGASAAYDQAPKKEGWMVAGTIHSHGSMSAFHSGTDHADEVFFDGVHITVGKVDSVPEYSCSMMAHGKRAMCDPSYLIDGMAPADAVPLAWLEAVKLQQPRGMAEPFAARASALYERYYVGMLAEPGYVTELGKIEREAEEARKASLLVPPATPSTSFLSERFPSFSNKKKGGKQHGRR